MIAESVAKSPSESAGPVMEMAKLLIAHGADVNARTSVVKTPLSLALEKGHHEMVALLREHGARE